MFVLPDSTIVNKVIPKNAFDRYTNSKQKQQFTDKVGKIKWMNKLSPETINLAGNDVKEIQVFFIELRQKDQIPELLKIINKAIPYHIIFTLSFDNKEMISATEKHTHPTNEDIAVVDWTFTTDWFTSNSNIYKLNLKRSLDFVFTDFVFQISGRTYSPELTISELISKEQKIKELTNRIEKLKTDIRNCRQFNRKVELNQELMQNQNALNSVKLF
jgi:hypothetical protein